MKAATDLEAAIAATDQCSKAAVALMDATGCTPHNAAVAVRTLIEQTDHALPGRDVRLAAAAGLVRTTAAGLPAECHATSVETIR